MYQFDVNRIVGIKLYPVREAGYQWLPEKPRPSRFFGLIKTPPFPAGFYPDGDYMDGCWVNNPKSEEYILDTGYLIDKDKIVFRRATVTIYLESEYQVSQQFNTTEEAEQWISELVAANKNQFEIIK